MKPCVCVFGPTASGKSSMGLRLAKELNGVIISADSMQIYREMDIGTAKPTLAEQAKIPHRLIDICHPKDSFSVYDFKALAECEIRKAFAQGLTPIVLGGTGLYLDALFFNTDFGDFEIDPNVRLHFKERSERGENALLLEELKAIDPECAERLHEKDSKRIIRALEVYHSTGKTLSEYKKESQKIKSEFSFIKLNLIYRDRQNLYDRINARVDQMVNEGLIEETEALLKNGYLTGTTASQAIGYKELLPYLEGKSTLEDCINLLKQKTRNYAKRQMTWFRRYGDAHSIVMDGDDDPFEVALKIINSY